MVMEDPAPFSLSSARASLIEQRSAIAQINSREHWLLTKIANAIAMLGLIPRRYFRLGRFRVILFRVTSWPSCITSSAVTVTSTATIRANASVAARKQTNCRNRRTKQAIAAFAVIRRKLQRSVQHLRDAAF